MRASIFVFLSLVAVCLFGGLPASGQGRAMTIADLIAADDDYVTLRRLLNAVPELNALLDDENSEFTFYAPTEAAYNALFSDSMMTVEWYLRRPAEIDIMLRQQIVPVARDMTALPFLNCHALGTMLADNWLYLEEDDEDVLEINFDPVDAPAQTAANGLLVPVDHLFPRLRLYPSASDHSPDGSGGTPSDPRLSGTAELLPAEDDVRAVLEADGRFTSWLRLLDQRPDVQTYLDSNGLYTLFIPTDDAFADYLEAQDLDFDGFAVEHPAFVDDSVAPGYSTPDILMPDITFNSPGFCTLQADGVMHTSDDPEGVYIDEVKLTGESLVARNAVIYVLDGVRFTQFYG